MSTNQPATAATTAAPTVTLTGVKPTGSLHLGNYIGAIKPLSQLASEPDREVYVFVADLHSLNALPDPGDLRRHSRELAAALTACGALSGSGGASVHVYRQSRVPQIPLISSLLGNVCAKGHLNRAHAYKSLIQENRDLGREPDHAVNMGLYTYPLLMAADILALDAAEVPVGADQSQHLEIASELTRVFNHVYGDGALTSPRAVIDTTGTLLPGLDGRKMSKSYGNVIPLFADEPAQRKQIARIVTNSLRPEDQKDPDTCTVYQLIAAFADTQVTAEVREAYLRGGIGYGDAKRVLGDAVQQQTAELGARYRELLRDADALDGILAAGEQRAAARAQETVQRMYRAMGL